MCADRSAGGTMPLRAYRFCEPLTSAASLGFYVFPPLSFSLMCDGSHTFWRIQGEDRWKRLDFVKLPQAVDSFDNHAPDHLKGLSPDFLSTIEADPTLIQIWSGLAVRTLVGWSTLVRGPVNFGLTPAFTMYEGIVDTDSWFGPLFTNIRINKTETPINFNADMPFLQILPIERASLRRAAVKAVPDIMGIRELEASDWRKFSDAVGKRPDQSTKHKGHYAVENRRRASAEAVSDEQSTVANRPCVT